MWFSGAPLGLPAPAADDYIPGLSTLDILETAVGDDAAEPVSVSDANVLEVAVGDDAVDFKDVVDLLEAAVGDDAVTISSTSLYDIAETARGSDAVVASTFVIVDISEAAVGDDAVDFGPTTEDLLEAAVGDDAVTLTTTAIEDVLELAVGDDALTPNDVEDLLETAVGDDAVTLTTAAVSDVLETAVGDDAVTLSLAVVWDVLETAVGDDALSTHTESQVDVLEVAQGYSYGYAFVAADMRRVWTAPVQTWAMSSYTGVDFTSMADEFVSSSSGLYEKGTGYADADLLLGTDMMNSPNLKTMPYGYTVSAHANPLTFSVTGDVDGIEATYDYTQMARDASAARSVRCDFGMGFRSTYFGVRIVSSGYLYLHNFTPVIEALNWRV